MKYDVVTYIYWSYEDYDRYANDNYVVKCTDIGVEIELKDDASCVADYQFSCKRIHPDCYTDIEKDGTKSCHSCDVRKFEKKIFIPYTSINRIETERFEYEDDEETV